MTEDKPRRYVRRDDTTADEVVVTEAGVTVSKDEGDRLERVAEAVKSQRTAVDEQPNDEYKTVTYVGEEPTIRTVYGTLVKDKPVRLPADVVDGLVRTRDTRGNEIFKV